VPASPSLSVAVVSIANGGMLDRTLCSLELQEPARPADVLVVFDPESAGGRSRFDDLARRFESVRFVAHTGNVPMRRARGVQEARGEIVALIEDSCVPVPGWAAAIAAAHARGEAVVGGPVTPAPGLSATEVAAFLVEFGAYLARRDGWREDTAGADGSRAVVATTQIPGCNLSYSRALLARNAPLWADGLYETFANAELARSGAPIWFARDARVLYGARARYGHALAERFSHGRTYGGLRVRGRRWEGLLRAAVSPLLVPLFTARTVGTLAAAGTEGLRLASAVPATIPLFAAWALGEMIGNVAGPGRSAERWT